MTNEEVEQQRQQLLTLLRETPDGLTLAMLMTQTGLDVQTLSRRLRTLRTRRKVDEVVGVWFATAEVTP